MKLFFLEMRSGISMAGQDIEVSRINNLIEVNCIGLRTYGCSEGEFIGKIIVSELDKMALAEKVFQNVEIGMDTQLWEISGESLTPGSVFK